MEHRWNEIYRGKPKYWGGKPVPVPLCPPQIPHWPTRDRTRASAVTGRRLTTRAMAWSRYSINCPIFIMQTGCLLRGTSWIFKYKSFKVRIQTVKRHKSKHSRIPNAITQTALKWGYLNTPYYAQITISKPVDFKILIRGLLLYDSLQPLQASAPAYSNTPRFSISISLLLSHSQWAYYKRSVSQKTMKQSWL
jgi:hypothetical protein